MNEQNEADDKQTYKGLVEQAKREGVWYAFDDYQEDSRAIARYPIGQDNMVLEFLYTGLAMTNEAGEVAGEIKKMVRNDRGELTNERRQKLICELGDVLWYGARLCDLLGVGMSEVAKENIRKLSEKMDLPTT